MKKCAVIIGVNRTGQLPILSAAVSGAKEFESWARSQGFDTALHTDERQPVTISSIRSSVQGFIDQRTYSMMIIFFAGHGILKSAGNEFWLLSEAPENPNEAVNVIPSKWLARNTALPHIVFISDACRSRPESPLLAEVTGSVIFPNIAVSHSMTDVDMFYATYPGCVAFEAKEDLASQCYKGVYTSCLLDGLKGNVPEIITTVKVGDREISAVIAHDLKDYLRKAVPRKAMSVHIAMEQTPDAEVTSYPPKYIAKVETTRSFSSNNKKPVPLKTDPTLNNIVNYSYSIDDQIEKFTKDLSSKTNVKEDVIKGDISLLTKTGGYKNLNFKTGFIIVGAKRITSFGRYPRFDIHRENDQTFIEVLEGNLSRTLLIEFDNGQGTPIAILPNFIGTVIVENNQVINVNYTPSRGTNKHFSFQDRNIEIENRRALVATAARYGAFHLDGDSDSIIHAASYLRYDKAFDPTLGLYAAYAYAQAGHFNGIHSIYKYMKKEPEPVLFDVFMLSKLSPNSESVFGYKAPFCPMLTQGWSYLSIDYSQFSTAVRVLSSHLVPGLWTTFTKKGVEIAKRAIKYYEI